MKFFAFLLFSALSLNSSFALDVFEPYPVADMKNSYQGFKGLLKEDWTQKEPATDEEKMVVEMVRDPKTQGIAKSVLYVQYLRKLVIETATGQSAAPVYSRMLQAALRGAHCGGINVKKKASDQEKAIMKAGAQKVGEVVAPLLLILDPAKRDRFVDKSSDYWAYSGATLDEAIQRHVNIVTAITKSTVFSAVNLFREYNKPTGVLASFVSVFRSECDPVEDAALRDVLDTYQSSKSIAQHLPYGNSRDFDRFIPSNKDVLSLSARAAIGWMALLEEPKEDVSQTKDFLPYEKRLIAEGLRRYELIDDEISNLIKRFNKGVDDRPWKIEMLPEEKIRGIKKVISVLEKVFGLRLSEMPKATAFDLPGLKKKLSVHLNLIGKTAVVLENARDLVSQALGSEASTFTIQDTLIANLGTLLLQHTNVSQAELERAASLGLMVGSPVTARNPLSYNPILKNIFGYLRYNMGEANDHESKSEALAVLRSFDYAIAYELLHGDALAEARTELLEFLQFAMFQKAFPDVRQEAIEKFEQFLLTAWYASKPLTRRVANTFDTVSFHFPRYHKDKNSKIAIDGATYTDYKEREKTP